MRLPQAWAAEPGRRIQARLQRFGLHPGGSWSLAWVLLYVGGVVLDPADDPVSRTVAGLCAALFAGLTWVGALAFAGRRAPPWILPVMATLGVVRGAVAGAAGPVAGDAFSLLYEPLAIGAAVGVLWNAELLRGETGLRIGVLASLAAVALLEVVDGLPVTTPVSQLDAWAVVAPAAAFFQLGAMWTWIARRELRIERAEDEQRHLASEVARERRANALLRRKEAWLFDFFEKAPDLLLVLAPDDWEILRCNRRFSETLGHARRELVGRSLLDFMEPDSVERVRPLLRAGSRRLRNLRLHLRRHDGSGLVVLANLASRDDPGGGPELRGVLHDVTGLQGPLVSREEIHRLLAEHAAPGMFHADVRGRCDAVNGSFCELTGVPPERAEGRSWLAFVHPDDRRRVEGLWERTVARGAVLRVEHRLQASNGRPPRVLTECIPLDTAGVGGFAGSMTRLSAGGSPASLGDTPRSRNGRRDRQPRP